MERKRQRLSIRRAGMAAVLLVALGLSRERSDVVPCWLGRGSLWRNRRAGSRRRAQHGDRGHLPHLCGRSGELRVETTSRRNLRCLRQPDWVPSIPSRERRSGAGTSAPSKHTDGGRRDAEYARGVVLSASSGKAPRRQSAAHIHRHARLLWCLASIGEYESRAAAKAARCGSAEETAVRLGCDSAFAVPPDGNCAHSRNRSDEVRADSQPACDPGGRR